MNNCAVIAVIYHDNCFDGIGSAFSVSYAISRVGGIECDYIPLSYDKVESFKLNKTYDFVYVLDFSFKEEKILELKQQFSYMVILDHHKTAKDFLLPIKNKYLWLDIHFDMNKSGARMAWEYFNKDTVPPLIEYIEDRDLWNFNLPLSKEVHAALSSYPKTLEAYWELYNEDYECQRLIREGSILLRKQKQQVDEICASSWIDKLSGYNIAVVNTSVMWSEVGNKLLEIHPNVDFAASFTVKEDNIMWSLRSKGDFDVSAVAKMFGGGGHKNAAGFVVPKDEGGLP